MTMTLRRSDSLPTQLTLPVSANSELKSPQTKRIPDSNTVPNFNEVPAREDIIATWKSLHTDVKNIQNGVTAKNKKEITSEKRVVTPNSGSTITFKDENTRRKITYGNIDERIGVECNISSPLETVQAKTIKKGATSLRRRTLLQRLLSWRASECDCCERYELKFRPKSRLRTEDMLCTCGASGNRINPPRTLDTVKKNTERGRSKSLGYEAAREVTQFRRLVACIESLVIMRACLALFIRPVV